MQPTLTDDDASGAAVDDHTIAIAKRVQKGCAYCGLLGGAFFAIGFLIAGFVPPPSPGNSPEQFATLFADNVVAIKIGLIIVTATCAIFAPFFAALSVQMCRVDGVRPALAWTQFGLGLLGTAEFLFPLFWLQAAALRTDRDPKLIQLLNDMGWMTITGPTTTFLGQMVALIVVGFLDRRELVFPRWYSYLNVVMVTLMLPGDFIVFFPRGGPLSYNGAISFMVVAAAFLMWIIATTYVLLRAIASDDYIPTSGQSNAQLQRQIDQLRAEFRPTEGPQAG